MKKVLITFAILSIFAASFFPFKVLAQESASSSTDNGIILFMQGDVKVKSAKSEVWVNAEKGMVLSNGDNIKTGVQSWAELGFGKDFKNSVRIQENTHVVLTDLGAIKINLIQGELRSLVEKLSKNTVFEIRTPVSICGVRGTGWDTITDGKTAEADAYENSVYFSGLPGEGGMQGAVIDAGKMGLLFDPAQAILIEDLPADKMNDWNKWKEDFMERRGIETGSSSGGGNTEDRVNAAVDQQAITEGGMDKVKPSIFDIDDEKQVDNRIDTERTSGGGRGYQ